MPLLNDGKHIKIQIQFVFMMPKKIPVGDGQLVPNVNGPVEVQLPQNLDLKEMA